MKIGIGNDHVAVEMKNEIKAYLEEKGHKVVDFGTNSSERCNYPVYGEAVANAIVNGEVDCGVLICGTGVGISLSANKVNEIEPAYVASHIAQDYLSSITTLTLLHLAQELLA